MIALSTVPNEARCLWTQETHILELSNCCPISHNPQIGSKLSIIYEPQKLILEVASLRTYIDSYRGGKDSIRSMEGMIQAITQDAADVLQVYVRLEADLVIEPNQRISLK